jgi:hypothetical protein
MLAAGVTFAYEVEANIADLMTAPSLSADRLSFCILYCHTEPE